MPAEIETLDSTETVETDTPAEIEGGESAESTETTTQTETPTPEEQPQTPAEGQQAAQPDSFTLSKSELNELVKVMARREAAETAKLEQEQRKAQVEGKPKRVSAWDRDPALAKIKTGNPDVYDATSRQVRAVTEDMLHDNGIPLEALKHIVERWHHLEGHVYRNEFKEEAREAAKEVGITDAQMGAADKYAQEQWKKGRSGDYTAMFSEFSVKQQRAASDAKVRAEKAGKLAKQNGGKSGDTGPGNRGGGGEKVYVASAAAEAALKAGDMTVMMEEMRKQRGMV